MKLHEKTVIWPANLDLSRTRREGRKLPKGQSLQAPRLEEMSEAAKRLGIEPEPAPGRSRPNLWWERGGYLILPKKDAKADLLRTLAAEIKKIRTAKVEHEKERKQR